MPSFCGKCGSPIAEGTRFCARCGAPVQPVQQQPVQQVQQQPVQPRQPMQQQTQQQTQQFTQDIQNMMQPKLYAAAERSGEVSLDLTQVQNAIGAVNNAKAILNPFSELLSGVVSFFRGIVNVFRNPKGLIFAGILAVVWTVLIILKQNRIGGIITDIWSWLTFAQGGMSGGILGMIGGVFGKIAVAAGLYALIDGGKDIITGMKQWFVCFKDKANLGAILIGAGTAMVLYNFFAANTILGDTMAAIAGILLAMRSLGSQNGFIFGMAQSVMSRKLGNVRVPDTAKANALISGIGMGAALAIPLSAIPFGYIAYIIGAVLLITGIILHFALGRKGVQAV